MRTWLKIFLALMVIAAIAPSASAFPDDQAKSVFAQAIKAYHAANYADAIKLNESILAQGFYSSAVYYNIGNAHYKLGHLGSAILYYLRAQALEPRDSDVKANLSFARSLVENYAPWPTNPLFAPLERSFTDQELLWSGFVVFALTGIFLLAGLYSGTRRKRLVLGVVIGCGLGLYIIGSGVARAHRSAMSVCIKKVDARFEPSAQATVYFKVPEGTEVRILRSKEGWAKVERSDNKIGWVPESSVERM
jgi:tetratricopeptide (TPR) repeat protein